MFAACHSLITFDIRDIVWSILYTVQNVEMCVGVSDMCLNNLVKNCIFNELIKWLKQKKNSATDAGVECHICTLNSTVWTGSVVLKKSR